MDNKIKIAVDAMGGDGSPKKIIDGISDHNKKSKNIKYLIFGNKDIISKYIPKSLDEGSYDISDTKNFVEGKDTPLEAVKRGKNTSMWLSIESVKDKKADFVISAGNTGALLVIS